MEPLMKETGAMIFSTVKVLNIGMITQNTKVNTKKAKSTE
jgi:hypothetical protein